MANLTEQKPMIRITYDEMEAYILLPEPELAGVGGKGNYIWN